MELSGTIKKIFEAQTFPSGFQKREMILLTQEQYPQPISIEFLSEKIDLLNDCKEGDEVKVSINLRGREWTNPQGEVKYFNSIVGWRIDKVVVRLGETGHQDTPSMPQKQKASPTADDTNNENVFGSDDDDDLPF